MNNFHMEQIKPNFLTYSTKLLFKRLHYINITAWKSLEKGFLVWLTLFIVHGSLPLPLLFQYLSHYFSVLTHEATEGQLSHTHFMSSQLLETEFILEVPKEIQDQLYTATKKQSAPLNWTDALNRKKKYNWLQDNTVWCTIMLIHFVQGQLWQKEGAREDVYQINYSLHLYPSFLETSTAFLTSYHRQCQLVAPQFHGAHRLLEPSSHPTTWSGVTWDRDCS